MSSEQGPAAEVPHVGDGAAALEEPDSDQEFLDSSILYMITYQTGTWL